MSKESFKSKIAGLNQTHTYVVESGVFCNTISTYRVLLRRIDDYAQIGKWLDFLKKEKYIRSQGLKKGIRQLNLSTFPNNEIFEDCKNIIKLLEEEIKLCQEPSIGNTP